MINVYSKTTTTFNTNGQATLIPISCSLSNGINGSWQLTMEHPFDAEGRHQFLVKDAILRVTGLSCVREWESSTQMFRIYDTKKSLTSITVIAFPLGMEATYDAPIEHLYTDAKTGVQAASMLDSYVKTTDSNNKYTVSSNINNGTKKSEWENTNLIAAISGSDENSFVNIWGGEVVYDNYKIKIQDKIGNHNEAHPYPIRYGRNLTGLEHEIDSSSVVTRIYPVSSDDLRLNTWTDVTDQGGVSYVTSSHSSDYPFIRATFAEVGYSLIDTNTKSHTTTANSTETWRTGMTNTMLASATTLWTAMCNDVTNTYSAEYFKTVLTGEGGASEYLQNKFVFAHKGWQSFVKSCAKNGVEWIKESNVPTWEWHEDTSVTPHAWWYGDDSVTPATSYAKNCYVKIGKYWEYFNDDGFWLDYKRIPAVDMEWHEAQDESGRRWYGYQKGYYAHDEYVYMTVEGQMKEWYYDSDGWYDEDSSGDSDMGWHGDASTGIWFGEEDAGSEDKNKYIHDRWAWIDGNYYWFDQYGYTDADPVHSYVDYPWFVQETTEGKSWFGNDSQTDLGSMYFSSQWAKIDGEWYYFDADGYAVDMDAKKSEVISSFANTVYNDSIDYVKTCLTAAYTLLYNQMTAWCNAQFDAGLDMPTVNVSVNMIDLSKTAEYKDYANLERICLGDKVQVVGRDGSSYEERVVGLTYDCIRGYNTNVEIGELSKTVGQIVSTSFKGTDSGTKLIAGDNVVIDGKVISVGDYVGRTIGLQDVLMDGSTIVSGNVASFGFAAGEKISLSRNGNTITINSTGGDGDVNLYHGISVPDAGTGDNNDIYIQLASQKGSNIALNLNNQYGSGAITGYSATGNADGSWNASIVGQDNWEYHTYVMWRAENLTVGKEYTVTFGWETLETPSLYGMGELFGVTIQHNNTCIDMRNYSSELVEDGAFKYFPNQERYGEFWYQSFCNSSAYHNYEFTFVAKQTTEYIGYYLDRISGGLTTYLRQFGIGLSVATNEIKDIYYKLDGAWIKDERGIYEPFTGATTTTDGEEGLVPQPLIAEKDKYLKGDGSWGTPPDTTYNDFVGATTQAAGSHGLVPAPTTSDVGKVLGADGTWVEQTGGTEVEANPSGTATDTLNKVDIDGTIYDLAAGVEPVEMTWANYKNLTPEQKADPTKEYFVKGIPDEQMCSYDPTTKLTTFLWGAAYDSLHKLTLFR